MVPIAHEAGLTPEQVSSLLSQLTLEEKVSLLVGADMWHTVAIERLGIPALKMTDGPNGARGGDVIGGVRAAAFPAGIVLASTWNARPVERVGPALGQDITNTGQRRGQTVVQVYVHDVASRLQRLEKELKAFAKVTLEPGERKTVPLPLTQESLAYFDDQAGKWVARRASSWCWLVLRLGTFAARPPST